MDEPPFLVSGQGVDSNSPSNESQHISNFVGRESSCGQPYPMKHERERGSAENGKRLG